MLSQTDVGAVMTHEGMSFTVTVPVFELEHEPVVQVIVYW